MRKILKFLAWVVAIFFLVLILGALGEKGAEQKEKEILPTPISNTPPPEVSERAKPKGSRVFGMHVTEAQGEDFGVSLSKAKDIGVRTVNLSLNWNDIERSPGKFEPEVNFLEIANAYYPTQGISVDLVLRPVDTGGPKVPSDLKGKKWNDQMVIERFSNFLDYVFTQIPNLQLNFLGIGNEIDHAFGKDAAEYEEYAKFLEAIRKHVKKTRPALNIGAIAALDALIGEQSSGMKKVNESADIILVTYYPLEKNFSVKNETIILEELNALLAQYPQKKIYFSELGFPTSEALKSSEAAQASFFHQFFDFWDAHSDQIPSVAIAFLTDSSEQSVSELTRYYNFSSKNFKAYLGSLGLRDFSGRNKAGYEIVKKETRARGF